MSRPLPSSPYTYSAPVLRNNALACLALALIFVPFYSGCSTFQPLRRATQQQVTMARQWTRGGIESLNSGRLRHAKSCFSKAAEQNPNDQIIQANLARAEARQGELGKAIEHMVRAVELSGNDPRLVVELGEMYLKAGQWLPAKRQAELALERNHRFAPGWALQGKTNLAKGDLDTALSEFQRAVGLDSSLSDVQLAIVQTYQMKNEPLRALSAVEQMLSQFPRDQQPEPAILAKGVALMDLKQVGPAIDLLHTASKRDGASSEVFMRLSQAQLAAGQVSQARLTLVEAKKSFPRQTQVIDSLLAQLQTVPSHVASLESANVR